MEVGQWTRKSGEGPALPKPRITYKQTIKSIMRLSQRVEVSEVNREAQAQGPLSCRGKACP